LSEVQCYSCGDMGHYANVCEARQGFAYAASRYPDTFHPQQGNYEEQYEQKWDSSAFHSLNNGDAASASSGHYSQ
jgi:hypothetical protein